MLLCIINTLPLLAVLVIALLPQAQFKLIRVIGLGSTVLTFFLSIVLLFCFDVRVGEFQYVFQAEWVSRLNWNFIIGVDGISLIFVILTTFTFPLCLLSIWKRTKDLKLYVSCFLILESFLLLAFTSLDLFLFYIFFEAVLMPMFLIIGIWGSGSARIKASYYFFFYTLAGSFLFLIGIFVVYSTYGSTDFSVILSSTKELSWNTEVVLFVCFGLGFAVKMPLFPFHLWLPEAHVQAPTEGSVILASLLLKLGGYGFIRVMLPIVPGAMTYFSPVVSTLCFCSLFFCSLSAMVQVDLKKIIAYSSVAHMAFVVLGVFSENVEGIQGAIFLMVAHGLVSSGLFFLVGFLYDRHHTRDIRYYGGLADTMPIFSSLFFFFTAANVSFPGTASFVGEILVFIGIYLANPVTAFLVSVGMLLGTLYSFWMFNRLCFLSPKISNVLAYRDLTRIELFVVGILVFLVIVFGVNPNLILDLSEMSVRTILEFNNNF